MSAVISVRQLAKRYRSVIALDGVDLEIARGEVFGLIGPNGAGKTTLIRAIVGALQPSSGTVRVLGVDPLADRWDLRTRIGYMPQVAALYSDLSVRVNVAFFDAAHHRGRNSEGVRAVLELVGVAERADDPVRTLSGGLQQRVSLACAMVHEPELLILDEPTAGVDPELRVTFWERFRALAGEGTTVIVSTHQMSEAMSCDRVALLRAGRVMAVDDPRRLLTSTRATVRRWNGSHVDVYELDDYPRELPSVAVGADRLEVNLEPLDDIVLRMIDGGLP